MYHGIKFKPITSNIWPYDTWNNWYLIPTSRPVFNPPSMKTNFVDIPGANGHLDMSTVLTRYPLFNNREGSFEFIVDNGDDVAGGREAWYEIYSDIMTALHGKTVHAMLEDDPDYYYEGLFTVNNWKSNSDGTWSNITLDYNVNPYKYAVAETTINRTITDDELTTYINAGSMPVSPTFTVTSSGSGIYINTYTTDGVTVKNRRLLANGTHTYDDVVLVGAQQNGTKVTFENNGTVSMTFRQGVL